MTAQTTLLTQSTSSNVPGWVYALLLVLYVMYFVPTIVAAIRRPVGTGGVVALNVFLGWFPPVWVQCLVVAATAPRNRPVAYQPPMYVQQPQPDPWARYDWLAEQSKREN